jgi:hypothetical protein
MNTTPARELLAKAGQEVETVQRLLRAWDLARLRQGELEARAANWTVEAGKRLAARLPIPDEAAIRPDRARIQSAGERAGALRSAQPRSFARDQGQPVPERATGDGAAACYMSRDGQVYGPYRWEEMQAFARGGRLAATDMVWLSGWPEWVQASRVPELRMSPEN